MPKADSIGSHFKNILFPKLGATERLPYNVAAISFDEVDVDEVWEHFDLRSKAQSEGEHDLPPTNSSVLDGNESTIVHYVEGRVAIIKTGFKNSIAGIEDLIHSSRISDLRKQLNNLPKAAVEDLASASRQHEKEIQDAVTEFKEVSQELSEFKEKHGIIRSARYSRDHRYEIALLVGAAILEGLVNMLFFQQGLAFGFVGGFLWAIVLAAIDVLLVFQVARFVPWLVSGSGWTRIIGGLATIVTSLWLALYNLFTSHVREAVARSQDFQLAQDEALDALIKTPLGLQQADSWVLFFIGMLFTSMAIAAAIRWDDHIPFYGKLSRKAKEARSELDAHRANRKAIYYSLKKSYDERIDEIYASSSQAIQSISISIKTKERIAEMLDHCIDHHKQTGNALIAKYRSENQKWRSSAAPKRFDEGYSFDIAPLTMTEVEENKKYLSKQQQIQAEMEMERDRVREELLVVFDKNTELIVPLYLEATDDV